MEPDLTADRPVVHVHVPSFCECGATVVGVWYNKKPYYCQWFLHKRYAALRKLLEQNRCKSKNVSDRLKASQLTPSSTAPLSDSSRETATSASGKVVTSALSCTDAAILHHDIEVPVEQASGSSLPAISVKDSSQTDLVIPTAPSSGALGSPRHQSSLVHPPPMRFWLPPCFVAVMMHNSSCHATIMSANITIFRLKISISCSTVASKYFFARSHKLCRYLRPPALAHPRQRQVATAIMWMQLMM